MKKNLFCKLFKYLRDKNYRVLVNTGRGLYNDMSDADFLKIYFRAKLGYKLDLDNPKTFNEKLQWLKIHDHRPEYTIMVDKYLVKDYVSNKIGKEYIIPTIGVWDSPDQIDFNLLPNQFVLKCNHNSGKGMYICKNKNDIDISKIKKGLYAGLMQDYYLENREWPYKNVKRKIIAEKYISNNDQELVDYKLMCFNGKVKCTFVCSDRFNDDGLKVTFFDNEWNVLPFERHYPKSKIAIKRPVSFNKMIELAELLSENIPFLRVDFYEVNENPFFGELTFYPGSGFEEFTPYEWDIKLGDMIQLP